MLCVSFYLNTPKPLKPYCPTEHTLLTGDITASIGRSALAQKRNGTKWLLERRTVQEGTEMQGVMRPNSVPC